MILTVPPQRSESWLDSSRVIHAIEQAPAARQISHCVNEIRAECDRFLYYPAGPEPGALVGFAQWPNSSRH